MNGKKAYPFCLLADYFCDYNKITENTPYEIMEIDAKELFTANRLDLAVKYNYVESMETGKNIAFAKKLYIKHIEAFTDGTVREAGNKNKNSIESYIKEFDRLIAHIKEKGFDPNMSLIPVGKQNELFDGAHRTACAAYFGKKVTIIRFHHLSICYDYQFFRRRLLEEEYIEYMSKKLCSIREDIRCVCIWPSASTKGNLEEMKKRLREENMPIVYSKKIKVTLEEFKKIITDVYREESWVGNKWNNYNGAVKKAKLCYGKGDTVVLFFVQCKEVEELTILKEKVRNRFELKKHSVHTTDTKEQTLSLIDILLKTESNWSSPNKNIIRRAGKKIRYFYAVFIHIIKCFIGKPV